MVSQQLVSIFLQNTVKVSDNCLLLLDFEFMSLYIKYEVG